VAGERRWRAAALAGLERLPAVVRRLDDRQAAEWSLVENLQREDLNPIERAEAFQRLARQFELSHEQIAERVGVERSTISNALRLLALPEEVRELVAVGTLSAGHARAIAGLADAQRQRSVAQRVVSQSWSVRRLEAELKRVGGGAGGGAGEASAGELEQVQPVSERRQGIGAQQAHLADLERQLGEQLGTRVRLKAGRRKGTGWLAIEYFSAEHFEELMHRLDVKVSG
jgi:ParB family chromosome partitioning protein